MGREVRRVPPNWEHPCDDRGQYLPLHDRSYDDVASEWVRECQAWSDGTHPELGSEYAKGCRYYWEWADDPPKREHYRPDFAEDPTWFQVYENVSEGTPVTPPFPTKEELVDYLSTHGDFSEQRRAESEGRSVRPPSRESAEAFVESGYAPSFVVEIGSTGTKIHETYSAHEKCKS